MKFKERENKMEDKTPKKNSNVLRNILNTKKKVNKSENIEKES